MDSGDGLMLNLVSYTRKPPKEKANHINSTKISKIDSNVKKSYYKKNDKSVNIRKEGTKARKYIDPEDFVPISSLFNKNPEIPSLSQKALEQKVVPTFASENINDLNIETRIKENLKQQFNFKLLTRIQQKAIPNVLSRQDVMIKSVTGSGKTMCYAVPILHMLSQQKPQICRGDGTFALILLPTRELANQTYDFFTQLCKSYINIIPGLLVGGEKCKAEKARLRKGINILIATPGRFEYHLKETKCLDVSKLSFLVFDEADKILDLGYEQTLNSILSMLDERVNVKRQNILVSATLNDKIHNLASLSLKNPIFVDAETENKDSFGENTYLVPSSLKQFYVVVPAKLRLVYLVSQIFLKIFHEHGKGIVFAANKLSVIFLHDLYNSLLKNFYNFENSSSKVLFQLHGDMDQNERKKSFKSFKKAESAILFTTDVAARGLDIHKINWVFQYSCPTEIENYLHRIGRTARLGEKGQSLLFLLPSEVSYIKELEALSINIEQMELTETLKAALSQVSSRKINYETEATRLQTFIEEKFIKESSECSQLAIKAFRSYIQSYATYPSTLKYIFNVKFLHLGHIAKSFGLREAPTKFAEKKKAKQSEPNKFISKAKKKNQKRKLVSGENEIVNGPRTRKFKMKK